MNKIESTAETEDQYQIKLNVERLTDGSHVWNVTIGQDIVIPCLSQHQAETCATEIAEAIIRATTL